MPTLPITNVGDLYGGGPQLVPTPDESTRLAMSRQLVNAQWPRPVVWRVQVSIEPILLTDVEISPFFAEIRTVIGSGQSSTILRAFIEIDSNGTASYPITLSQGTVPGHDIQIQALLYGEPTLAGLAGGASFQERWDVSIYVAPIGIEQIWSPRERERAHDQWRCDYGPDVAAILAHEMASVSGRRDPVLSDMRWGDRDSLAYTFITPPT